MESERLAFRFPSAVLVDFPIWNEWRYSQRGAIAH